MQVLQILKNKGTDSVVTVPRGTSVKEALDLLATKRIGTVVVAGQKNAAAGILSERDIVRELSSQGAGALDGKVDDYMTTELVTCTRADDADDVLTKMTNGHFRHMPVVEDGQLVGLITLGDVVKARLSELSMEKEALEGMIMGH